MASKTKEKIFNKDCSIEIHLCAYNNENVIADCIKSFKHQINKDIKAGGDGPIDSDYEPSDEEISKYGIDNNVPTVTPDQKKAVRDTLKAKNAERGSDDDEGILVFGKKGKEIKTKY